MLDGDDGGETLADVVTGDLGILVLEQIVGLGELVDGAGEGAAEAGEVGAAVGIVDRVGVAEHLVVVGVVVLEDQLEVDFGGFVVELQAGLLDDADRLRVQRGLALVDLLHELLDAILVEVALGLGFGGALVGEDDLEAGVEEGELAQTLADAGRDEDGGLLEDLGVGLEGDVGAGLAGLADDLELLDGFAPLELHVVDLAAAGDLDLEPLGDGVDALGADAVRAAGELVAALAVLAAGVKGGEHQLHAGQAAVLVQIDGDATAVVADADGAIDVDVDVDPAAETREMLVDGVVQDLGNAVVEGAFVGAADVHAGLFPHGFQTLELAEFVSAVGIGTGLILGVVFCFGGFGHE